MYDIYKNKWTTGPTMVTPRLNHSCCTHGDKLYAIAGSGGREYNSVLLNSIEVVDASLWKRNEKVQWE